MPCCHGLIGCLNSESNANCLTLWMFSFCSWEALSKSLWWVGMPCLWNQVQGHQLTLFPFQCVPLVIGMDICKTREGLQLEVFLSLGTSFRVHIIFICIPLASTQSSMKANVHKSAKCSLAEFWGLDSHLWPFYTSTCLARHWACLTAAPSVEFFVCDPEQVLVNR